MKKILFIATLMASFFTAPLYAQGVSPAGPYMNWQWPNAPANASKKQGFYNFDTQVKVEYDPGTDKTYFYAHQFSLNGGEVGYIGIQEGDHGRAAYFSIWGAISATASTGAICENGADGAPGKSCHITYNWVAGHNYRLRVWALSPNTWGGWVKDLNTGIEKQIATITVPNNWGWLSSNSVVWTEYYAANTPSRRPSSCSAVPYTRVLFSEPTANGGSITRPSSRSPEIGTGECRNTRVTSLTDRSVHQEMGAGAGCTLFPNEIFYPGDTRGGECNGGTTLVHQTDGNVVLYGPVPGSVLWDSGTRGKITSRLIMQGDGNLVLYPPSGPAIWHTNTWGNPGATLVIQNDCNAVIYSGATPLWHTISWGCIRRR
jgi:hypothetical protein